MSFNVTLAIFSANWFIKMFMIIKYYNLTRKMKVLVKITIIIIKKTKKTFQYIFYFGKLYFTK